MTDAQRLVEAENALHQLETGQSVELTTYEGHTVKYTPAKAGELRAYIARIEARIAGRPARGALRIRFGR